MPYYPSCSAYGLEAVEKYGSKAFKAGMGAEVIKQLLSEVDLAAESKQLKEELRKAKGQKKLNIAKRLGIIDSLSEQVQNQNG